MFISLKTNMLDKLTVIKSSLYYFFSLLSLVFIVLVSNSYSNVLEFEELIYVSSISLDDNFIPQRISVIVENSNRFTETDSLEFSFFFEGEKLNSRCFHTIDFVDSTSTHRIIYCPIPQIDSSGELSYYVNLNHLGESIQVIQDSIFYSSPQEEVSMRFREDSRGTLVSLKVIGDDIEFPVKIFHEIPKEVIERLTSENVDDLIFSQRDFTIERENPIISWEVTSREQQVDYVLLDQQLDSNTKAQFRTYSHQENTLNFIVIFTILILLIIIFVPLILKSFKSKSNS